MMYENRLLKFVKAHPGLFTAYDIAAIWKRNKYHVSDTATVLKWENKIKINKGGLLSLR